MIRDIDEDLDLGRQYMPMECCQKHGLNLQQRDHSGHHFKAFIEEMFSRADCFYASADIGISMLPEDVRDVIRVARTVYHAIHNEIRGAGYAIFDGRVRVTFSKKVKIAMPLISSAKLARIVVVEVYALCLRMLLASASLLVVPATLTCVVYFATSIFALECLSHCTYAMFHVLFTLPPIVGLWYQAWVVSDRWYFKCVLQWTAVLCLVATLYTTPWDNYLVYKNVWGYLFR